MGLESVTNIEDLNVLWPLGNDPRNQGDDHLRAVKVALKSLLTDLQQIGFEVMDQALTEVTTEITWAGDAPIAGRRLTVFVQQDATGGRLITWDSDFFKYATTEIDLAANAVSVFEFVGRDDGYWYMVSAPLLGAV